MTREPTDDRKRRGSAAAWTVGATICVIGTYVAGYVSLGPRSDNLFSAGIERDFNHSTIAEVFKPAAWIEAKIRRRSVMLDIVFDDGYYPKVVYTLYTIEPLTCPL